MAESLNTSRFSVVVPVYNDREGLKRLIPQLANQSLLSSEYEIILVDNQSTDRPAEVVRQYQKGCDVSIELTQETDIQGSYAARNRGIAESSGEIIAFTDADCRPESDWLEQGDQRLTETDAELAAGPVEVTFQDDEPNLWEYLDSSLHLNQRDYVEDGWGATANLFVRRECFEEYGTFNPQLQSGGDCEFGKRVTEGGGEILFVEDALVSHPARRSFLSLMRKERRIARGHKQLSDMGKPQLPDLSLRDFLPVSSIPEHEEVDLSPFGKAKVLIGASLVRWVQTWYRL